MPYIEPDSQRQEVTVRFPGDSFPQNERHNTYDRREKPFGEVGVTARHAGAPHQPETEFEALMAAPGEYVESAEEVDVDDEYDAEIVRAYEAALPTLTDSQRAAWDRERAGLSQRQIAVELGITPGPTFQRLRRSRERLAKEMDWVIAPELKAKYRKPKQPAKPRPIAQVRCSQHIGTYLARSDSDDAACWQVGRGLSTAIEIGSSPTELVRRIQILPVRLAELVTEYRNS